MRALQLHFVGSGRLEGVLEPSVVDLLQSEIPGFEAQMWRLARASRCGALNFAFAIFPLDPRSSSSLDIM